MRLLCIFHAAITPADFLKWRGTPSCLGLFRITASGSKSWVFLRLVLWMMPSRWGILMRSSWFLRLCTKCRFRTLPIKSRNDRTRLVWFWLLDPHLQVKRLFQNALAFNFWRGALRHLHWRWITSLSIAKRPLWLPKVKRIMNLCALWTWSVWIKTCARFWPEKKCNYHAMTFWVDWVWMAKPRNWKKMMWLSWKVFTAWIRICWKVSLLKRLLKSMSLAWRNLTLIVITVSLLRIRVCYGASCGTLATAAIRLKKPLGVGNRCAKVRANTSSHTRKMQMWCSTPHWLMNWPP